MDMNQIIYIIKAVWYIFISWTKMGNIILIVERLRGKTVWFWGAQHQGSWGAEQLSASPAALSIHFELLCAIPE